MKPSTLSASASDAGNLAVLIHQQSADEVAQLLRDAQSRADRIRAAAAEEVDALRAAAEREGEDRGRRRAAALLAVAEVDSQLALLQAQESHIAEALTQTRNRLAHLSTLPCAVAVVTSFIRHALQAVGPGPVRVLLPSTYAPLLDEPARRKLGAGRWALHFEDAAVPGGGVIVETEDGRRRYDNSIDARLHRHIARLRQLAARLLWPSQESTP